MSSVLSPSTVSSCLILAPSLLNCIFFSSFACSWLSRLITTLYAPESTTPFPAAGPLHMLLLTPNILPLLTRLNLQVQTNSELFSEAFIAHLVQARFLSPFSYLVLLIKYIFYNSFRVIKQICRGYLGRPCLWFLINTCVSVLPLFQLKNQANILKPMVCSDSLKFPLASFCFV